jgi:hypothetical protein
LTIIAPFKKTGKPCHAGFQKKWVPFSAGGKEEQGGIGEEYNNGFYLLVPCSPLLLLAMKHCFIPGAP